MTAVADQSRALITAANDLRIPGLERHKHPASTHSPFCPTASLCPGKIPLSSLGNKKYKRKAYLIGCVLLAWNNGLCLYGKSSRNRTMVGAEKLVASWRVMYVSTLAANQLQPKTALLTYS